MVRQVKHVELILNMMKRLANRGQLGQHTMEQRALEQRAMERPTMEQRAMEQQRGLDQRRHQLNQINHNSVEATCKRQINKFHLPWLPVNEVAAGSCFGSVPGSLV